VESLEARALPSLATSISLASPFHAANVGQSVTLTATVSATPSSPQGGTVSFLDGAMTLCTTALVNGTASCTPSLSLGRHSITANYSGSSQGATHWAASTSLPEVVAVRNNSLFALGGSNGHVQICKAGDGALVTEFAPYGPGYTGGVNVAMGDVNGDGYPDLITAAAVGNPHVKVFDGKALANGSFVATNPDASLLASFFAYGLNFNVGANVAAGDIRGDGFADIVTGATAGNPHVKVFSGKDIAQGTFQPDGSSLLAQWFAYGVQFNIGANVAVGDIRGDGYADIVTGATAGNPHVKIFNGKDLVQGQFQPDGASLLTQWFTYGLQFNTGAYVAVGNVTGDGYADLITGSSAGNADVKVYSGKTLVNGAISAGNPAASLIDQFFAADLNQGVAATVAAVDFEGNGQQDILTGTNQAPPTFRVFPGAASGVNPPSLFETTFPSSAGGGSGGSTGSNQDAPTASITNIPGTYIGFYQGQIVNNITGVPVNGSGQVTLQIANATDGGIRNGLRTFNVRGTIQVAPFGNGTIQGATFPNGGIFLPITGTYALEQAATASSPERGQLNILGQQGSTTVVLVGELVGDTITVTEVGTSIFEAVNAAGTLRNPFRLTLRRI
jgi:hypothetical protein